MKLKNKYYIARHGQSLSNDRGFFSSWPEKKVSKLIADGRYQIKLNAKLFKKIGLDFIFASDLQRTKETAEIISKVVKISVVFDKRLREIDFGIFNGKMVEDYYGYFKNQTERFTKRVPKGENLKDVQKRMVDFIKEKEKKYTGKTILIVSHGGPLWLLESYIKNKTIRQTVLFHKCMLMTGQFRKLKP